MGRPKSKGAYAPLAAQYYLDDSILEAGPNAELMWVRVLSFLASVPTDGFLTERQIRMVGVGLRDWRQRVSTLQEVGLLTAVGGGYEARSWLKWNRTTEQQNKQRAKDRERKRLETAEKATNSARNPSAFQTDSSDQNRTEQNRTEQEETSSSEVADAPVRPDVLHLIEVMEGELKKNGSRVPSRTKKNLDAARLMVDRDKHTVEQIENAIRWAASDEFWRVNILSMSKLREKYDQLRLAAQRKKDPVKAKPVDWMNR